MKDARTVINWIKTPLGKFIMLFVILVFVLVISPFLRSMLSATMPKHGNYTIKEVEGTVTLNPGKFIPGNEEIVSDRQNRLSSNKKKTKQDIMPSLETSKSDTQPTSNNINKYSDRIKTKSLSFTPLDLYTSKSLNNDSPMIKFAPYGRMIPCELVNTIDSANTETPIIGLVTEDIYHEGKLLISAGTEVHGEARSTSIRDHIATGNSWILVWRSKNQNNGKELKLKGIALEDGRVAGFEGRKWSLTDGSAGIKGYTVDNRKWTELKAIALKMLSGIGQGMYKNNVVGMAGGAAMIASGGTWTDSLGKGLEESTDLYADMMLSKILNDGFFVRCPAGTTFYLYIEQTIDMRKAEIAGSRVDLANNNQPEPKVLTSQFNLYLKSKELEQKKQRLLNNNPNI